MQALDHSMATKEQNMGWRRIKENKGLSFSSCVFLLLAISTVSMLPLK
jgi:hypothetical protein